MPAYAKTRRPASAGCRYLTQFRCMNKDRKQNLAASPHCPTTTTVAAWSRQLTTCPREFACVDQHACGACVRVRGACARVRVRVRGARVRGAWTWLGCTECEKCFVGDASVVMLVRAVCKVHGVHGGCGRWCDGLWCNGVGRCATLRHVHASWAAPRVWLHALNFLHRPLGCSVVLLLLVFQSPHLLGGHEDPLPRPHPPLCRQPFPVSRASCHSLLQSKHTQGGKVVLLDVAY